MQFRNRTAALISAVFLLLTYAAFSIFQKNVNEYPAKISIGNGEVKVYVESGGAVWLSINDNDYLIESKFSYPGSTIGFNELGGQPQSAVKVKQKSADAVEILAKYRDYTIFRLVTASKNHIEIKETIRNKLGVPVGVLVDHKLSGASRFQNIYLGGYQRAGELSHWVRRLMMKKMDVKEIAENPTVYVTQGGSSLGLVARDSVSRLQLVANAEGLLGRNVDFGVQNFALGSHAEYTFEWDLYPETEKEDYFAFINKLRKNWGVNFTIEGPHEFFDVVKNKDILKDSNKLTKYFQRKHIRTLALTPWLDYDNYSFDSGRFMDRNEYKVLMQAAIKEIKQAAPDVRVIGCMEGNLVTLPPDTAAKLFSILPPERRKQGMYISSGKETALLDAATFFQKDSSVKKRSGEYVFEIFYPVENQVEVTGVKESSPILAMAVHPSKGNSQLSFWLDQAGFLLNKVGFDGIYIDQFNLAIDHKQRYSDRGWDGISVDIDPKTGQIVKKYIDGALTSIGAQKEFLDYALKDHKIVVANTHAAAKEIQAYPVYRFLEGGSAFNPLNLKNGDKPPLLGYLAKGHLDSPIALGIRPGTLGPRGMERYAEMVTKTVIVFLRNGLLYYYFFNDFPSDGPGSGEYGPVNHMFPITPVNLGEGFIEGKERIITAVSRNFIWPMERTPSVITFDINGREKKSEAKFEKKKGYWEVTLKLKNWQEIAVVE